MVDLRDPMGPPFHVNLARRFASGQVHDFQIKRPGPVVPRLDRVARAAGQKSE
jgi:hypothetical protein